ncbi:transposase [Streptomyces sp. HUAS ZL42]|uniref:IS701 family transposase n=1 Tax=Streptomyces sp. HUAS ZL42 TaxID=3231715 RepID=UPI00345EE6F2
MAVEASIAEQAWAKAFGAAMDAIARCFARREARETARQLTAGLLLELDTRNCWTLAEALGHPGPHRLQHLLSRACLDHDPAREEVAGMVIDHLAGQDVVLVVDETGDAKSSTGCVGAGRQYSGALGRVGPCQVAVHLAAVTPTMRVIIDRALYLPADWVADDERREAVGVPTRSTSPPSPSRRHGWWPTPWKPECLLAGSPPTRCTAAANYEHGPAVGSRLCRRRPGNPSGDRRSRPPLAGPPGAQQGPPRAVDAPADRRRGQGQTRVRLGLAGHPRRRHPGTVRNSRTG